MTFKISLPALNQSNFVLNPSMCAFSIVLDPQEPYHGTIKLKLQQPGDASGSGFERPRDTALPGRSQRPRRLLQAYLYVSTGT
jgi:hypothetical protein